MANDVTWIKISVDILDNRKINHLREQKGGEGAALAWILLLALAGKCNAGGKICVTERVPFSQKNLAKMLRIPPKKLENYLALMEELQMIFCENDFIFISNWEEHQNVDKLTEIKEQTRKRVAKYRKKQKECNVTCNANSEPHVTQCHATEEEKEEEEEEEEEKDIHSFDHSSDACAREETKRRLVGGTLGRGKVLLSAEQLDDLLDRLSLDEFNKYVDVIADCESRGRHYTKKTHYQAILDMAQKDRKVRERAV